MQRPTNNPNAGHKWHIAPMQGGGEVQEWIQQLRHSTRLAQQKIPGILMQVLRPMGLDLSYMMLLRHNLPVIAKVLNDGCKQPSF